MRIFRDVEKARATLLRHQPLELVEVPPALKQRIRDAFGEELTPSQAVERIIAGVRDRGDDALVDYTRTLDGVELQSLESGEEDMARAQGEVPAEVVSALSLAAERIRSFHQAHKPEGSMDYSEGGLGQLRLPLQRVGVYAPGGTASYPSTVLMTAIPARVAGVDEVFLATPPDREGRVPPAMLVAARLAGVDRVFPVGGAQAIGALALGTPSVPRVDKVCGPGNIFVQLAKRQVYGLVDIDGLYGPTETVILADGAADARLCAADLLAQAEHDPMASAVLITPSEPLALRVSEEIATQLLDLDRRDIAAAAIEGRGGIVLVRDMDEAIELANLYAPEHLALMVADASGYLGRIRNAGGIFLGETSPEALGDYMAGPSHVLPTGGTARFASPLGVDDFLKRIIVVSLNGDALRRLGPPTVALARAEGLGAHARAVEMRLEK
ncbi:MAG: histidinol dehydrogenase [Dehalococcoidia bacterium]